MRKAILAIVFVCLAAIAATAQTTVNQFNSGGETSTVSSSVRAPASGSATLTAGNLAVCLGRAGSDSLATFGLTDAVGNAWVALKPAQFGASVGSSQPFYSFLTHTTTTGALTLTISPASSWAALTCKQYSNPNGGTWHLDANPAVVDNENGGTSMTSNQFTTTQAVEVIVGIVTGWGGGDVYTAGTIGGTTPASSYTNGTNGTDADTMIEDLTTTATKTNATASFTISTSSPYHVWVASFYLTGSSNQAPAFTSAPTAAFVAGTSGAFSVTASGSPAPTITAAGLPSGATFASGTLTVNVTIPGTYPVTFTATNSVGSVTQSFSLVVNQASTLTITTTSIPNMISGVAYSTAVNCSGGVGPYTWTASGLPTGLSIVSPTNTCATTISGTPNTTATTASITVNVVDSE